MEIVVLNVEISSLLTFFGVTFFTIMSKFVLFSVGLVFPVIMSRLQVVLCNGTSG